jgi:hypothetical protein
VFVASDGSFWVFTYKRLQDGAMSQNAMVFSSVRMLDLKLQKAIGSEVGAHRASMGLEAKIKPPVLIDPVSRMHNTPIT